MLSLKKKKKPSPQGVHSAHQGMGWSNKVKKVFFGIIWIMINSICKIWGGGGHLLSFHGVNVCLNL